MTTLFDNWAEKSPKVIGSKTLVKLLEKPGGRDAIMGEFSTVCRDHYAADEDVADWIEALGFSVAADCLRENFPKQSKGRSADIGEILASEYIERELNYVVPVKKLRDKDHREQAMRGEDVIGVAYDENDELCLMKGEAKSARSLSANTIVEARAGLEGNEGRPASHALLFIGRRLLKSSNLDERQIGIDLMNEVSQKSVPKKRLAHYLFSLSGNPATDAIDDDFAAADEKREQHVINFRIPDHKEFIDRVFKEITDLGFD